MFDFLTRKPISTKELTDDQILELLKRIAQDVSKVLLKHEDDFTQLPGNGPLLHMVEVLCIVLRSWVALVFRHVGEADAQHCADLIKQLVSSGLDQQIRDCHESR